MAGFVADQLLGDPRRFHPVAGFGTVAARLEKVTHRDSVAAGAIHTGALVAGTVGLGLLTRRLPQWAQPILVAAATWTVVGGRSLTREATTIDAQLRADDLPAARVQVTHLVGRVTDQLSADEVARGTVESVAENISDAVVAPLFWGAVAGVPGLLGYRACNTLDAMIGHHTARYERFGKVAARLDDLVNLVPARLAAVLVAVVRPDRAGQVFRVWRRDAKHHPSPNAGVIESAFAAALDVHLGGRNDYGNRVEDRARMGEGPAVTGETIAPAARLATAVGWAAAVSTAALAWGLRRR